MLHYVYILECVNGSLYTGYTTDIERRYREHQLGSSKCRYTISFPPKKLLVYWELESKSQALQIEIRIKKLSKYEKQMLVELDAAALLKKLALDLSD